MSPNKANQLNVSVVQKVAPNADLIVILLLAKLVMLSAKIALVDTYSTMSMATVRNAQPNAPNVLKTSTNACSALADTLRLAGMRKDFLSAPNALVTAIHAAKTR